MPTTNAQRRKTYRRKHKAQVAAAHKDWSTRNLKKRNAYAQARRYGLTVSQVEAMRKHQEGRCAICNVLHETLVVDHSHATGRIRGLLCSTCNSGIGFFGDKIALLSAALQYLKKRGE